MEIKSREAGTSQEALQKISQALQQYQVKVGDTSLDDTHDEVWHCTSCRC